MRLFKAVFEKNLIMIIVVLLHGNFSMVSQTTLPSSQAATSTINAATIEDFGHGVTREWLYDKRIVVITRPDMSRESVDTWFKAVKQTYDEWPVDRAFLGLQDFSGGYAYTPYGTARTKELASLPKKGYMVYSAIVLPKSFTRSLIVMIMNNVQRLRRRDLYLRLFFDRAEALAWLKSSLDAIEAKNLPSVQKKLR
jgi:hypothetical protein